MQAGKLAQCFTQQELLEFASGNIPLDRLDTMAAHVDTCVTCQTKISDLDERPDSFVDGLRAVSDPQHPDEESACRDMVDQLVAQRSKPPRVVPELPTMPPSIGVYRVLEPLGVGGMGIVYKAQHPKLKRTVAIKLLPAQRWSGPAAVARFEREMEVIGGLDHPNIVRASDAGDEAGMHYLVMDFIDGLDLSHLVRRIGTLSTADACQIIHQAATGLAHVHSAGLVHRDMKPSNIMLTLDGQVKILDLGLAMLGEQYLEGENNLTTIGQLMGTLDYMAPEQAADSHQVDARADVYALGATLFKLLTGQPPYGGTRYNSLLKKVLALASAPTPSVKALRPELPDELDQIIQRCLAKDPDDRFAGVEEVADAIASFADGADLRALMQEAANHADRDSSDLSSWSMAAVLRGAKEPEKGRPAKQVDDRRRFDWFTGSVVALAFFMFFAAAAVILHLVTDQGELIIRSEDPNARILIKKENGQPFKELLIQQGQRKTTVRSGQYTVELLGNADRLDLSQNRFTMRRGEVVVLDVERRVPGESVAVAGGRGLGGDADATAGMDGGFGLSSRKPASGSGIGLSSRKVPLGGQAGGEATTAGEATGRSQEPAPSNNYLKSRLVYDNRSYFDWVVIVDTERNPERLVEAVAAISVLAPEAGSQEAAAALLRVMRAFGSRTISSDPRGKLVDQTFQALRSMEPDGVAKSVVREILQGNSNSRDFLYLFVTLLKAVPESGYRSDRHRTSLRQVAPEMIPILLEMSRSSDLNVGRWALEFTGSLVMGLPLDPRKHEGLLDAYRAAMESSDDETAFSAATILSNIAPETDGVVETLAKFTDDPSRQRRAIVALATIGAKNKATIPVLARLLKEQSAKMKADPSYGDDSMASDPFGSGGGMAGMGGMGDGMGGMGGGMGGAGGYPGMASPGMGGGGGYMGMGGLGMQMGPAGVVDQILVILNSAGPSAKEALPILQSLNEMGPRQDFVEQLIRKIQESGEANGAQDQPPKNKEGGR